MKVSTNFYSLGEIKAFLKITCQNRSFDELKSRQSKGRTEKAFIKIFQGDENLLKQIESVELRNIVKAALVMEIEKLKEKERYILIQYIVNNASVRSIAETLDIHENTVYWRLGKTLKKLRNHLEKLLFLY